MRPTPSAFPAAALAVLLLPAMGCGSETPIPDNDTAAPGSEAGRCPVTFTHTPANPEGVDGVAVAGTFNAWGTDDTQMTQDSSGAWSVTVDLPPGAYGYRIVEQVDWTYDGANIELCDPAAELIYCDDGYKEPWETDWRHDCSTAAETACSSFVRVPDCTVPAVDLSTLEIDRTAGSLSLDATATPGLGRATLASWQATLDGSPVDLEVAGDNRSASFSAEGLSTGRHTFQLAVTDDSGAESEVLHVPFWTDASGDDAWRQGSIYFAFVDRFANGDESLDRDEGTSTEIGGYMGGDFQGVLDLLPYLDELGVKTLWLSNPQDNAEGAWAGQCEQTYAGYHAYWPDEPRSVEEHFGSEELLHQIIEEAHRRGMRVIMDWVANHVHSDHPYATENGDDWFNGQALCEDGNWDRIPEECWFAPYLPDIDYTNPEALDVMVEDALWWAKTFNLDGFRVDAVKHMPHSVAWNLEARVRRELEHRHAGGDEQFWTVGETFDSYERINAYIHDGDSLLGLDGQFDFDLYYTTQSVFGSMQDDLSQLEQGINRAAEAYGDALMSSFLDNHDVVRFVTEATEGYQGACGDDGIRNAQLAWDPGVYHRMRLAWTFLFTQRPVPLVYYGGEIGMPGYADPDNRQPLWWYADTNAETTVESVASQLDADRAALVRHVAKLGQARQAHPALYRGTTTEWWRAPFDAPTLWAYARVDESTGDEVLVILNRSDNYQTLENSLAYAGLTPGATYEDVLSGETFTATGDALSVGVARMESRVLVKR